MALLVMIKDAARLQEYEIDKEIVTIGRLGHNDIVIQEEQVSRSHAVLKKRGSGYEIEDLGSTNYVYVNHRKVKKRLLRHGDLINIGGVIHMLYLEHREELLVSSTLEKMRQDPEFQPQAYSVKKTMLQLVDELSSAIVSAEESSGLAQTLEDIEALYEISYTINSTLNLREVLSTIVNKVIATVKAERGCIMLYDANGQLETVVARNATRDLLPHEMRTFSRSTVKKALEKGKLYISTNTAEDPPTGTDSMNEYCIMEVMCTPLKVKNETIGVLYADTRQASGGFSRRDSLFFEAISHQAGIAIANARLAEELEKKQKKLEEAYEELKQHATSLQIANKKLDRKVAELSALYEVSRSINMTSNLDTILKLILEKMIEILDAERGSIMLCDENEETLKVKVVHGVEEAEGGKRITLKVGEGIAGLALREGKPIAISDGYRNEKFKLMLPRDKNIKSLMCVPLLLNKRRIGVINITNKRNGEPFTEDDKSLALTLANQAAITIENARLYNLAIYDSLTGLHERSFFFLWLKKEFERSRRYESDISMVMLDIDDFKLINDTYGHQAGDFVLQGIASIIKSSVRSVDLAARYGGEEFTVILPQTSLEGTIIFAERIRKKVEATRFMYGDVELRLTISIGVSSYPEKGASSEDELIYQSDIALYKAKRTGKNRVVCYEPAIEREFPVKSHRFREKLCECGKEGEFA